jgi:hypothetical protein
MLSTGLHFASESTMVQRNGHQRSTPMRDLEAEGALEAPSIAIDLASISESQSDRRRRESDCYKPTGGPLAR